MSNKEQSPDASPLSSADGYTFEDPTLDLGALVVDGDPAPDKQIRGLLGALKR